MSNPADKPTTSRDPRVDLAFDQLDDDGKMAKLQHHLNGERGWPVPAPWVRWLLSKMEAARGSQ